MSLDVLILNSGEWTLASEIPAEPWHIAVYRQVGEPRNELHIWLPRQDARRKSDYVFRRYWVEGRTRWCVEIPRDPDRLPATGAARIRFASRDGCVLWAAIPGSRRLGDFTDSDLRRLRESASAGPFSRI